MSSFGLITEKPLLKAISGKLEKQQPLRSFFSSDQQPGQAVAFEFNQSQSSKSLQKQLNSKSMNSISLAQSTGASPTQAVKDFYKELTRIPDNLNYEEIEKAKESLKATMEKISGKVKKIQVHANLDANDIFNLLYS